MTSTLSRTEPLKEPLVSRNCKLTNFKKKSSQKLEVWIEQNEL